MRKTFATSFVTLQEGEHIHAPSLQGETGQSVHHTRRQSQRGKYIRCAAVKTTRPLTILLLMRMKNDTATCDSCIFIPATRSRFPPPRPFCSSRARLLYPPDFCGDGASKSPPPPPSLGPTAHALDMPISGRKLVRENGCTPSSLDGCRQKKRGQRTADLAAITQASRLAGDVGRWRPQHKNSNGQKSVPAFSTACMFNKHRYY